MKGISDLGTANFILSWIYKTYMRKSFLVFQKKSHFVTGARDSISRTSLFETVLMMCRSTSDLSLLVWMQFLPTYRITLTCHLASTQHTNGALTHRVSSTGAPQPDGALNKEARIKIRHYRQVYEDRPDPIVFAYHRKPFGSRLWGLYTVAFLTRASWR